MWKIIYVNIPCREMADKETIVQDHGFDGTIVNDVSLVIDHLNFHRRGVVIDRMRVGLRVLDEVDE